MFEAHWLQPGGSSVWWNPDAVIPQQQLLSLPLLAACLRGDGLLPCDSSISASYVLSTTSGE
jgi:hypothetical protein